MPVFKECRLCSSKNDLMWVFNRENESGENMQNVIYITAGVEIHKNDVVSQKVCENCIQITNTMFKFRKKCIENDRRLKDMFNQYLKNNGAKIPDTDVTIEKENKISQEKSKHSIRPTIKIHPSITDLFKIYPRLKLPTPCLNYHVSPLVSMPLDEVENYFKNRNLNINEYIFAKSKKVNTNFGTVNSFDTSNYVINAEIISDENKDEDTGIIRPIKIKIIQKNSVFQEVGIDNSDDCFKSNNNIDNRDTKERSDTDVLENPQIHRKRKFSEVDKRSNKENGKALETLELTPKVDTPTLQKNNDPLTSLSYIDKSVSLHICDICNSVHYNSKKLRKHQVTHLRCQFCKLKFRNLESKSLHLENTCTIKNTTNNLPDIEVQKIEYDNEIREKYPDAFRDFSALKIEYNVTNSTSNNTDNSEIAQSLSYRSICLHTKDHNYKDRHITAEDVLEIIEILSDDEEAPNKESTNSANTEITIDKTSFKNIAVSQAQNYTMSSSPAEVVNNKLASPENVISNIVEVVQPSIRITNCNILSDIDSKASDTEVLRTILSKVRSLRLFAEKATQTYLPTNQSIFVNLHQLSAELKNLKQLLPLYYIPVVMKDGNFDVRYNYKLDAREPKRLHLWNDLKPIDINISTWPPVHYNVMRINSNHSNNNSNRHDSTFIDTSLQRSPITNSIKTNIVHRNPLLNNLIQTQNSLTSNPKVVAEQLYINSSASNVTFPQPYSLISKPQAIVTPIPCSSCASLSPSNINFPPQQGAIRVKNMSELI